MVEDKNKHKINRITATVACNKKDLSGVQSSGLASCIEKSVADILPLLDRKFKKKWVRLDSLSIEVSVKNRQLNDLDKLISQALEDAIQDFGNNQESHTKKDAQEFKNFSPQEVFVYFLQHGKMPWFSAKLEWEKLDFTSTSFIAELRELLHSSSRIRERLVSQFTVDQVKEMLSTLNSSKTITRLFQFAELVKAHSKNHSERFAAGFRLRQTILKTFLDHTQKGESTIDFESFLKQYWPLFIVEVKKECNGEHETFLQFLTTELKTHFSIKLHLSKNAASKSSIEDGIISTKEKNNYRKQNDVLKEIWEEEKSGGQQMVANAGIVLLHPFLARFFNKVGLLANNQFISLEHQQRGICLLYNLATGELVFPEEKLVLCKYLCNYPQKLPVPRELPISNFELQEIDTVLHSAIEHWTALKRTSKDGLRVNFLQRKGLIEEDSIGQTIHVENHAADILLDQLPWGLSTIHLPWLPDLLTIKWR